MLAERKMDWRDAIQGLADVNIRFGEPLAPKTSFRIGGPAECLARPTTGEAVAALCCLVRTSGVPMMVLGGGTNVLISDDGIPGVVVELQPSFDFVRELSCDTDFVRWEVGAGAGTGKVLRKALSSGLRGIEALSGVPGSIGGALMMNAGGHEGEIEDSVVRVQIATAQGVRWISRREAGFCYRGSAFPQDCVILASEFSLTPADTSEIRERVRASLDRRKKTQPLSIPKRRIHFQKPQGGLCRSVDRECRLQGLERGCGGSL